MGAIAGCRWDSLKLSLNLESGSTLAGRSTFYPHRQLLILVSLFLKLFLPIFWFSKPSLFRRDFEVSAFSRPFNSVRLQSDGQKSGVGNSRNEARCAAGEASEFLQAAPCPRGDRAGSLRNATRPGGCGFRSAWRSICSVRHSCLP